MPRSNREYLLRYADQAIGNIETALGNLKAVSDAYGGVYKPVEGETLPVEKEVPDDYMGNHGKYQQAVDLIAAQIIMALDDLKLFRSMFM